MFKITADRYAAIFVGEFYTIFKGAVHLEHGI